MTAQELTQYMLVSCMIVGALWGAYGFTDNRRGMGMGSKLADYAVGAFFGLILGAFGGLFLSLIVAAVVWFAHWPSRW